MALDRLRRAGYFAAHRALGSHVGRVYGELRRWDAPTVNVEEIQLNFLRDVLLHAARHVPLYRGLLTDSSSAIATEPRAVLESLPVLTKQDLQTRFDTLLSDDADKRHSILNASGGSTGIATRFMQDRGHSTWAVANRLFAFGLAGNLPGQPLIWVTGNLRDYQRGRKGIRAFLGHAVLNSAAVNAFDLSPAVLEATVNRLRRGPAALWVGYASALHEVARYIERTAMAVPPQKAICCTSDMLYPEMRIRMEHVFGCRVFNRYGCKEIGDMACECDAHDGLHVLPWQSIVEILDDRGRPAPHGEIGHVVASTLHNYSMPLLRFDTGDMASLVDEPCSCGRSWPRLARVQGRFADAFRCRDGTLVDEGFFTALLLERPWVDRFQLVQEELNHVTINVVAMEQPPSDGETAEIVSAVSSRMGADCVVVVNFLTDIPALPSGKYRYTVCMLDDHEDGA